jgi:N-acetylmuramoyl-L-alanine amidase
MARIIISAGHTNKDPGTIANGLREADLTKQISREVVKQLRESNIITLAVPPELDLAKRIEWINLTGYSETTGDITIEIHINDGGKRGIEGWFQADKNNSRQLTQDIIDEVTKNVGWPSQGNHNEYEHPLGSLAFLHNTHPIASLVECGYLDNEEDFKILSSQEGILKIATGIVNGIKRFLGVGANPVNRPVTIATTSPAVATIPAAPTAVPAVQKTMPAPIQTTNQMQQNTPMNRPVNYPTAPVATYPTQQYGGMGGATPGGMSGGFGNVGGGAYGGMGGGMSTGMNTMGGMGTMGGVGGGMNQGAGFMNRDQRRDMVKNNYIKILGREPSPADLNYFLNIGISEDQLIRKMVDSQEHADLVKARQEVIQTKKLFIDQRSEILRLKTKVNDQRGILQNLNSLLMQKNRALVDYQQKLQMSNINSGQKKEEKKFKYKKTKGEKMLDYFSDRLGK